MSILGRRRPSFGAICLLLGGLLVTALALPLVGLLTTVGGSFREELFRDPQTAAAFRLSLFTATVSTVLLAAFGVPLGYVLARGRIRFRRPIMMLAVLPMVIPGLAGGILLLQTYGPNSTIGRQLSEVGVVLAGSRAGVILAQCYVACPFVVVSSMMAFVGVDPKLEAAASTLGDSSWRTFRRVTLPLAWPGIAAGLVLAWMRALGEFAAVMIVAYNPRTLPVHLWVRFESRGLAGALPVALLLVAIGGCSLVVWRLFSRLTDGSDGTLVPTGIGGRE